MNSGSRMMMKIPRIESFVWHLTSYGVKAWGQTVMESGHCFDAMRHGQTTTYRSCPPLMD